MESGKAIEQTLRQLYNTATDGYECRIVEKISAAGSNRKYFRLHGNSPTSRTLIGTYGENTKENQAFCYLSRIFCDECGLNVPKVLGSDGDCYVQEDLGDVSLFDCLADEGATKLVAGTISMLPDFQWKPLNSIDFNRCYPTPEFDTKSIMWDLNYFKYCFLKTVGIEFDENRLETELQNFACSIADMKPKTLVLRDFQSRNIMIHNTEPYVIDFQGARKGPCHYDLASFLWQVRAKFSDELKEKMIELYLQNAGKYAAIDPNQFRHNLHLIVLFRTLQVLGAYGFRGLVEGKPHFMKSIIPAVRQLERLLTENSFSQWPYLTELLRGVPKLPLFNNLKPESEKLIVVVNSFGFRKSGIPADLTGNGGGYVFDCRALPNPGRLKEFKQSTGMDSDVAQYLEQYDDVAEFLKDTFNMVDRSVSRYLERGFTDLNINFGCTGGQHRSVYCAEQTAKHIHNKFGIDVFVNHTEQKTTKLLTNNQ